MDDCQMDYHTEFHKHSKLGDPLFYDIVRDEAVVVFDLVPLG